MNCSKCGYSGRILDCRGNDDPCPWCGDGSEKLRAETTKIETPRAKMSILSGDRAWILFAKVDEASGSEPALDPSSFSWMPVTVKDVAPDEDGLPGAWVILEDGAHAWYERRFLLTEEEARAVLLPSRPGGRERFLERARKGGPPPHGVLAAGPLEINGGEDDE